MRNEEILHRDEEERCVLVEVRGRRQRRLKGLLDDLKEKREYCKLKEEAVDCALWRTRLEGPVDLSLRQTDNE